MEHKILDDVKHRIDDQQKSYFLNEQIKAIEKELGKRSYSEADEYVSRLGKMKFPKDVAKAVDKELTKLDHMAPFSPESTVARNYLDWIFDLPWGKYSQDKTDLAEARRILDRTHYGLKEAKARVMEFLAVKVKREKEKIEFQNGEDSTVLCLTGPPGVGKTTLAKSVAEALGRKFVRISLGGVSDESEIRGHRRTYIGSMPGRIIFAYILLKKDSKLPIAWEYLTIGTPTSFGTAMVTKA
jgi:ATP-dependent Lon protease